MEKIKKQKNNCAQKVLVKEWRGFAMAEALIAVAVLSIGIVAAVSLISKGLNESIDSKNQAIAAMLAQEGAELVRNLRDNNWASGTRRSFDVDVVAAGFPAAIFGGINCGAFYNLNILDCSVIVENKLGVDGSGYYTEDATGGKFQRKITIKYLTAADALTNNDLADVNGDEAEKAIVTSVVVWGSGFPAVAADGFMIVNNSTCNTATKCAYSQVILDKWHR